MGIKDKVYEQINSSTRLKTRLALDMGKSVYTISKWILEKSDNLTKIDALKIIAEELEIPMEELLEEESIGTLK